MTQPQFKQQNQIHKEEAQQRFPVSYPIRQVYEDKMNLKQKSDETKKKKKEDLRREGKEEREKGKEQVRGKEKDSEIKKE